jgi:hypothetical protein
MFANFKKQLLPKIGRIGNEAKPNQRRKAQESLYQTGRGIEATDCHCGEHRTNRETNYIGTECSDEKEAHKIERRELTKNAP